MPEVKIQDKGCRGCTLCVDICPVDVFQFDQSTNLASVAHQDDCIGCLSCFYVCPSQCVTVGDVELLRPFHRIEKDVAFVESFLQTKSSEKALTDADIEEALSDVGARLNALSHAVNETMGRAQKAVGRKAGAVASEHLPEMYEEETMEGVLKGMQERMKHSFDFDFQVNGKVADFDFHPCGLYSVVTKAGEQLGESTLCKLFHEYWAGLMSSFTGDRYDCEVGATGQACKLKLSPRE